MTVTAAATNVYVNGFYSSGGSGIFSGVNTERLIIGDRLNTLCSTDLDEVQIYSRALSPGEILAIGGPAPPNDDCSNPTYIFQTNANYHFDTTRATADHKQFCPTFIHDPAIDGQDVWFCWIRKDCFGGLVTINTCDPLNNEDTIIVLYPGGCSCPTASSIALNPPCCNDQSPVCSPQSTVGTYNCSTWTDDCCKATLIQVVTKGHLGGPGLLSLACDQGAGDCNYPPQEQTCCFPDLTCENLDLWCCSEAGGTSVSSSSCTQPEACCLPNGTCVVGDHECCEALGGTPQGAYSQCGCAQGCCDPRDGACVDTDSVCCATIGGYEFPAGEPCSNRPKEACCSNGSVVPSKCDELIEACCTHLAPSAVWGSSPAWGPGAVCLGDANGDQKNDACFPPPCGPNPARTACLVGNCPAGETCVPTIMSGNSITECGCKGCEPNLAGTGCLQGNCPPGKSCIPTEVTCSTGQTNCKVTECGCKQVNLCRLNLGNPPSCTGSCTDPPCADSDSTSLIHKCFCGGQICPPEPDPLCDDGLFCNGCETSDPATGECRASDPPSPCPPGFRCDEAQHTCRDPRIPTVSQWGLVVLTLLLLIGAKIYFARRETATD